MWVNLFCLQLRLEFDACMHLSCTPFALLHLPFFLFHTLLLATFSSFLKNLSNIFLLHCLLGRAAYAPMWPLCLPCVSLPRSGNCDFFARWWKISCCNYLNFKGYIIQSGIQFGWTRGTVCLKNSRNHRLACWKITSEKVSNDILIGMGIFWTDWVWCQWHNPIPNKT